MTYYSKYCRPFDFHRKMSPVIIYLLTSTDMEYKQIDPLAEVSNEPGPWDLRMKWIQENIKRKGPVPGEEDDV